MEWETLQSKGMGMGNFIVKRKISSTENISITFSQATEATTVAFSV